MIKSVKERLIDGVKCFMDLVKLIRNIELVEDIQKEPKD